MNFDGFRIDTIKHVENDFWKVFAPAVRQRLSAEGKNNFIMFGEAFNEKRHPPWQLPVPGELDSVFSFFQHYSVLSGCVRVRPTIRRSRREPNEIQDALGGEDDELWDNTTASRFGGIAIWSYRRLSLQGARELHRQPRRFAVPFFFGLAIRRRS